MADQNDPMIIPAVPKQDKPTVKSNYMFHIFAACVFAGFISLLFLVSFLPVGMALKILFLIFGSFILTDLFHSFKKQWR